MAYLRYYGSSSQVKAPTNPTGTVPPDGKSPHLMCFLLWSDFPAEEGPTLFVDEDKYPYTYEWLLSTPRNLDGTPLFSAEGSSPSSFVSPIFYRPNLPNATTGE